MHLHPLAADSGVKLIAYDTIGSTNTEALALARKGERGPLWITAMRQTAGRGRRGNIWISEAGNLYATLLLSGFLHPQIGSLSFLASLAACDALVQVAPHLTASFQVKWPNDILLAGEKIAGVLIESEGAGVAVGIGINCRHHPTNTSYPATDLAAAGLTVSPEDLFLHLTCSMERRLSEWARGAGFSQIRSAWLMRAAGLGEAIRVRLPARELVGEFQTLDEIGRLVLRLPDGRFETISAGEVFAIPQLDSSLAGQ